MTEGESILLTITTTRDTPRVWDSSKCAFVCSAIEGEESNNYNCKVSKG
jgi:hypothetical protein